MMDHKKIKAQKIVRCVFEKQLKLEIHSSQHRGAHQRTDAKKRTKQAHNIGRNNWAT